MSKRLVAYFSASGVTAKVAENLADAIGADIFEIQPEVPYTKADLNWMDKKSRSTIEMSDPTSRPAIAAKRDNMDELKTTFLSIVFLYSSTYFIVQQQACIQIAAAIYTQARLRTSLFCFLLYQLSLWWVKYRAQPEAINS